MSLDIKRRNAFRQARCKNTSMLTCHLNKSSNLLPQCRNIVTHESRNVKKRVENCRFSVFSANVRAPLSTLPYGKRTGYRSTFACRPSAPAPHPALLQTETFRASPHRVHISSASPGTPPVLPNNSTAKLTLSRFCSIISLPKAKPKKERILCSTKSKVLRFRS